MDEQRSKAYFKLINALLSCPSGKESEVLKANQELIDKEMVLTMVGVAGTLTERGDLNAADWLQALAGQLAEALGVSDQLTSQTTIKRNPAALSSSESYSQFLIEVLQAISDSDAEPKVVYPLLQANLDKLDDNLVQVLRAWFEETLSEVEPEQAQDIAVIVSSFSSLIQEFPLGSRASNLEIASTGFEAALTTFTREAFPQEWGIIQNNLGNVYKNRIRGNRYENLEQAIACYENALQIYTRNEFPELWAATQNNLANAYGDRIYGKRAENLEQAIIYYRNALQVYTREAFPEQWATTQNNLGATYSNRIYGDRAENLEMALRAYYDALQVRTRYILPQDWAATQSNLAILYSHRIFGDRAENLEQAIACYQKALQVYTPEAFPQAWAMTQNNLAVAYRERIPGDRATNLEMSIQAYQAALQVRTREAFPEQWAATQSNLAVAYGDRIYGQRAENLEQAMACCESALLVYTRKAFPEQWARTQSNLATAYRELGQIAEALTCYRNALEVFSPTAFPLDCLRVGRNLGDTASAGGYWTEAIEGYGIAIEAVEQSRTWASTDARRQEILSAAIDVYAKMVQACINTEQFDRALEYVERSKARNLVEILANRDLYPKGGVPETVLHELERLRREITVEQRRLDIAERSGSTDGGVGSSTNTMPDRTHLEQLRKQLDELIKRDIHPLDPAFNLTQTVEPITFKQIQQLLPDDQTALMEWYVTGEKFFTFIVISQLKSPIVWQSSLEDQQALGDWTSSYLSTYYGNKQRWRHELDDHLRQLAEILHLNHLLSLIPTDCQKLILIPHRFLHMFPLHALEVGGKEAEASTQNSVAELRDDFTVRGSLAMPTQLGERNTHRALPLQEHSIIRQRCQNCLLDRFPGGVSYAPSCQLLQTVEARHTSPQQHDLGYLFAVQNPTNDLPYTDIEVTAISSHFDRAHILAKQAATKEALNQTAQAESLRNAHYVHFSCHGSFNLGSPLESLLLLANNEHLTLGEIFGLNLSQCRLVTLSACETGLTDITSLSDEYISLPSGFLYAGSLNVVSSLWDVNDIPTTFLMIKFYENLKDQTLVAMALSQAQRWLRDVTQAELEQWIQERQLPLDNRLRKLLQHFYKIQSSDQPFANPFYWAAFTCQGLH